MNGEKAPNLHVAESFKLLLQCDVSHVRVVPDGGLRFYMAVFPARLLLLYSNKTVLNLVLKFIYNTIMSFCNHRSYNNLVGL